MRKNFSKTSKMLSCVLAALLAISAFAVTASADTATIGTIGVTKDATGYLVTVPVTTTAAQATVLVTDGTAAASLLPTNIYYADQAATSGSAASFSFYMPSAIEKGDEATVRVGGTGLAATETTVTMNAEPLARPANLTPTVVVNEGTANPAIGTYKFVDADDTAAITSANAANYTYVAATGALSYNGTYSYAATTTDTVVITCGTITCTVTINVNDKPVFATVAAPTVMDSYGANATIGTYTATNAAEGPLTYGIVTTGTNYAISDAGVLSYNGTFAAGSEQSVVISATDANGAYDIYTVSFTVGASDAAPVAFEATTATVTVNEATNYASEPLTIGTFAFKDADGEFIAGKTPAVMSVTPVTYSAADFEYTADVASANNGALVYKGTAGAYADDANIVVTIGYTGNTSTVTIPVNDKPAYTNDSYAYTGTAITTETDSPALGTFAVETNVVGTVAYSVTETGYSINAETGALSYTGKLTAGNKSITVTATDSYGLLDTCTVTFTVTQYDFAPVAAFESGTRAAIINEGTYTEAKTIGTYKFTDANGEFATGATPYLYSVTPTTTGLVYNAETGALTFTGTLTYSGDITVTLGYEGNTATVIIPVNDKPAFATGTAAPTVLDTYEEDSAIGTYAAANTVGTLTYSVPTTDPQIFAVSDTGVLTATTALTRGQAYSVVITATDSLGLSDTCTVSFTVADSRPDAAIIDATIDIPIVSGTTMQDVIAANTLPQTIKVNGYYIQIDWDTESATDTTVNGTLNTFSFTTWFKNDDFIDENPITATLVSYSDIPTFAVNGKSANIVYASADATTADIAIDASQVVTTKTYAIVLQGTEEAKVFAAIPDDGAFSATLSYDDVALPVGNYAKITLFVKDAEGNVERYSKNLYYDGLYAASFTIDNQSTVWKIKQGGSAEMASSLIDKNGDAVANDTVAYEIFDKESVSKGTKNGDGTWDLSTLPVGAYTVTATFTVDGAEVATMSRTLYIDNTLLVPAVTVNGTKNALSSYKGANLTVNKSLGWFRPDGEIKWAAAMSDVEPVYVADDSITVPVGDTAGTKYLNVAFKVGGELDSRISRTIYVQQSMYSLFPQGGYLRFADGVVTVPVTIRGGGSLGHLAAVPAGYKLEADVYDYMQTTKLASNIQADGMNIVVNKAVVDAADAYKNMKLIIRLVDANTDDVVGTCSKFVFAE